MNKKTKIKLSLSDRIFNAVNIFIMLVIMAVMLAPIIHVVCVSFSLGSEIQKGGLFLWPHGFTLEGYKKVLQDHMIVRSYINTVIYAFSHTALVIILTALTAYPLTIKDFPLRKGITIFITITMFFTGTATKPPLEKTTLGFSFFISRTACPYPLITRKGSLKFLISK